MEPLPSWGSAGYPLVSLPHPHPPTPPRPSGPALGSYRPGVLDG